MCAGDPVVVTEDLASRYGRTRQRSRRDRWLFLAGAVVAAVVVVAWALWAGLANDSASLQATDTAYTIVDEHTVRVSFAVTVDAGTAVTCAVQALDESHAVIGWKVVSYPAATHRLTTHTETVRTTELANTGLIYRCSLS